MFRPGGWETNYANSLFQPNIAPSYNHVYFTSKLKNFHSKVMVLNIVVNWPGSFNFIFYVFWQQVFDALISNTDITLIVHWTLSWTTSAWNVDICYMCMIFVGEIYTSIMQWYAILMELNNASFQKNIPVETTIKVPQEITLFFDGWIWMESKACCEKIPNHIKQMIKIPCIWQLQFVLYGSVTMETESNATHKCQC